jgi:outer membrane immunogenic protein
MTIFRKALAGLVGAALIALGLSTSVQADGYAAPQGAYAPPFTWTGLYVGTQVGAGWDETNYDLIQNARSFHFTGAGGFAGSYAGYNQQFGSIVAGVEVEGSFSAIVRGQDVDCTIAQQAVCSSNIHAFGSVRGRLGYAAGKFLVYGTGGWAVADASFDRIFLPGSSPFTSGVSHDTRTGWVIGGGAEVALGGNWIGRFQYDHYDFGHETYVVPALSNVSDARVRLDVDTIRLGIAYKFGERLPASPLK